MPPIGPRHARASLVCLSQWGGAVRADYAKLILGAEAALIGNTAAEMRCIMTAVDVYQEWAERVAKNR